MAALLLAHIAIPLIAMAIRRPAAALGSLAAAILPILGAMACASVFTQFM